MLHTSFPKFWFSHEISNVIVDNRFYQLFSFFFLLFRATPTAYGSSQARGRIGAVAAGLCHSHSNTGSLTHWARPGIEPSSSWILVGFNTTEPYGNSSNGLLNVARRMLILNISKISALSMKNPCFKINRYFG